ncbi:hypothetical protein ACLB1R_07395 [Escherichia coli]
MTDDFAPDGQLAKAIPGFKPQTTDGGSRHPGDRKRPAAGGGSRNRSGQNLRLPGSCAAGKKKVIISTGSKALQDQLYSRDLPTVSKALKYTGNVALLKGRSNYLCLERLEQQALAGGDLPVQIYKRCDPAALLV